MRSLLHSTPLPFLLALALLACEVDSRTLTPVEEGAGSGGETSGTGGESGDTGGAGGEMSGSGSGGQTNGSGGQTNGSGGETNGSGGDNGGTGGSAPAMAPLLDDGLFHGSCFGERSIDDAIEEVPLDEFAVLDYTFPGDSASDYAAIKCLTNEDLVGVAKPQHIEQTSGICVEGSDFDLVILETEIHDKYCAVVTPDEPCLPWTSFYRDCTGDTSTGSYPGERLFNISATRSAHTDESGIVSGSGSVAVTDLRSFHNPAVPPIYWYWDGHLDRGSYYGDCRSIVDVNVDDAPENLDISFDILASQASLECNLNQLPGEARMPFNVSFYDDICVIAPGMNRIEILGADGETYCVESTADQLTCFTWDRFVTNCGENPDSQEAYDGGDLLSFSVQQLSSLQTEDPGTLSLGWITID